METELIMVAHVCTVAVYIPTTITSMYKVESTKIRFEMLNPSIKKCVGTYFKKLAFT